MQASPFGRGVTAGDGEGKPGLKGGKGAAISAVLVRAICAQPSGLLAAALPSQARCASSPKGGAFQGEVRPYEELNYDFSH